MNRRRAIIGLLILALASYAGLTTFAVSAPADIEEKRAEAERVLAEIQELDGRLGLAIEDYNGATLRLSEIEGNLESTGERLDLARESGRVAQDRLAERLRALYMSNDASSLEVILGAASVEQLLDRVSTVERVSARDQELVESARGVRVETAQRERKLKDAKEWQAGVVADREQQRQEIEALLAQREQLASSIESELEQLIAEEQVRQEQLRAEAERRLAAQRAERRAERRAAAQAASETAASSQPASSTSGSTSASSPAPAPAPAPTPPPPPGKYSGVVATAMQYLGVPYVWGGGSPSGFDCSGFVMYVYAQHGVSLPHHAATQYNYGAPVSRSQLEPGDLVFFNGLGHMGIYIGGDQFVHAPHTGDVVKISSLNDSWYAATWVGARRL